MQMVVEVPPHKGGSVFTAGNRCDVHLVVAPQNEYEWHALAAILQIVFIVKGFSVI